jgi:hypothetical protein
VVGKAQQSCAAKGRRMPPRPPEPPCSKGYCLGGLVCRDPGSCCWWKLPQDGSLGCTGLKGVSPHVAVSRHVRLQSCASRSQVGSGSLGRCGLGVPTRCCFVTRPPAFVQEPHGCGADWFVAGARCVLLWLYMNSAREAPQSIVGSDVCCVCGRVGWLPHQYAGVWCLLRSFYRGFQGEMTCLCCN